MSYLKLGNLTSIIAGFLILALLVQLGLYTLSFAFTPLGLLQMTIIWILSIPAFYFYHKAELKRKYFMDYMAPTAIVITFAGLVLAFFHEFLGLELILLGYIFEPLAGLSIFFTVKKFLISSQLFFWGAVIYTIGLPFYIFNVSEIAIIGDAIKLVGLLMLAVKMKGEKVV